MIDAQRFGDPANILILAFEGEGRGADDHRQAAPDHTQQAKGSHEFAEYLCRSASDMRGQGEKPQTKHEMSHNHAAKSPAALREDVGWNTSPGKAALHCIRKRDGRIEMRTGDTAECQDQRDQHGPCCDRICQKSNCNIPIGETLGHNA